jgi:flagellar protein FliO/FliZ
MEFVPFIKYFLGLIFVLGLIAGAAWLARHFGMVAKVSQKTSGQRRLEITEVLPVDAKRRLILVKRDDKEHLILLGQEHDLIVEQNIDAPAPASDVTDKT